MKASNAALGFRHPDLLQGTLGFRLLALRQFVQHVRGLVHPAALLARSRPDFAGCLPETERTVCHHQLRRRIEPAPLEIEQPCAPVVSIFPFAIGKSDKLLAAFRRRTNDHEDALLLVFEAGLQMNAVSPDVDVAFG